MWASSHLLCDFILVFTVGIVFCSLNQIIVVLKSVKSSIEVESWDCQQIALPSGGDLGLWAQQGGATATAGASQDPTSIFTF